MGLLEDDLEPTDEERPIVRIYRPLSQEAPRRRLRPPCRQQRRYRKCCFPMWGRAKASPTYTCPSSSSFSPVRRNLTIIVVLRMKFNDSATLRRTLTYLQRPNRPTLRDAAMIRYTVHTTMEELRPPLLLYYSCCCY